MQQIFRRSSGCKYVNRLPIKLMKPMINMINGKYVFSRFQYLDAIHSVSYILEEEYVDHRMRLNEMLIYTSVNN